MVTLIHQRCFNHAIREAVALCPECRHYYCRECVTEHDGRLICAACLRKMLPKPLRERAAFMVVVAAAKLFFGLMTAALFFYLAGQILLSIDTSFHEGTIWKGLPGVSQPGS